SLEYWEELGTSSQITRSSSKSLSGIYSCRFQKLTSNYVDRSIRSNEGNHGEYVVPNENYSIKTSFYLDNNNGGDNSSEVEISIHLEWHDYSWNHISSDEAMIGESLKKMGEWENKIIRDIITPENAAHVKLRIEAREIKNNNYDLYIDEVKIIGPIGLSTHKDRGYLKSLIYDSGDNQTQWNEAKWSGSAPNQTSIELWVRLDNSLNSISNSNWIKSTRNPLSLNGRQARYIQYKVIEHTENQEKTPQINQIELKTILENQYLRWEHRIGGLKTNWENYILKIKGYTSGDSENVKTSIWNNTQRYWEELGSLTKTEKTLTKKIPKNRISNYLIGENLTIKYESINNTDSTQTRAHINYCYIETENKRNTKTTTYIRTSSDGINWFDWEGPYWKSPVDLEFGENKYIQYKAELRTEDNSITPIMDNIKINYFLSPENGVFISQPIRTGLVSSWRLEWSENTPRRSELEIRTRSSENKQEWSNWSKPLENKFGANIPSPKSNKEYLQIKVDFHRGEVSPRLENYKIIYTPDEEPPRIENFTRKSVENKTRITAIILDDGVIDWKNIDLTVNGKELYTTYYPTLHKIKAEAFLDDGIYQVNLKVSDIHGRTTENSWRLIVYSKSPNPPTLENLPRITNNPKLRVKGFMKLNTEFGGDWSETPEDPPVGIGNYNGLRITEMNNEIYFWTAYGGKPGGNGKTSENFYKYTTKTNSWTQLEDAPFGSAYGIGITNGVTIEGENAIYIIKGYWSGQKTWFARYTENNAWESLNHEIPFQDYSEVKQDYPRNGSTLIWDHENHIYFFPGSSYDHIHHDWYRYSIPTDNWEFMGELPMWNGMGNAATFVNGSEIKENENYLYVMLGLYHFGKPYHGRYNLGSDTNKNGAKFARYGLSSRNWEILTKCGENSSHPYGADDGSSLVWNGGNYIYHTPGAYEEVVLDLKENQKRKFMKYSISENEWSEEKQTPYNKYGGWDDGGGIILIENTIYGLKGGDDTAWLENKGPIGGGSVPANNFWSYDLPQKTRIAENKVIIYIDNNPVKTTSVNDNGKFITTINLPEEKSYEVQARSLNLMGEPAAFSRIQRVTLDLTPPEISIHYPANGFYRQGKELEIKGKISEPNLDTVTLVFNEVRKSLSLHENQFEATLKLEKGLNEIKIEAIDLAGNKNLVTINGIQSIKPPNTSETIINLLANELHKIILDNHPFVREIQVTPTRNLDNLTISIEGLSRPQEKLPSPSLIPYNNLKMKFSEESELIENISIIFRVENYWFYNTGINPDSVKLLSHENNWTPLRTRMLGSENGWTYYRASINTGNSSITIIGEKPNSLETPLLTKLIFGITGILITSSVLLRSRIKKFIKPN
ncbi:MAG: PGF-pre-PGF domain-containing protein, partial [Hadesarchaea archaeon]|nr:PGF-pre-PGF domain-containing protein [Hadesarchaea archaeon]